MIGDGITPIIITIITVTGITVRDITLVADTVEYGIQVNGKIRARIALAASLDKAAVEQAALAADAIQPFLSGKTVRKVIVVKNIVNIVVG